MLEEIHGYAQGFIFTDEMLVLYTNGCLDPGFPSAPKEKWQKQRQCTKYVCVVQ